MKKIVCCLLFLCSTFNFVYAEESSYFLAEVLNGQYQKIAELETYEEAYQEYDQLKEEYQNLILLEDERVLRMEYGIVEFVVNDTCTLNQEYIRDDGSDGYLNGCYGIDGIYLGSDEDKNVFFMISGDRGSINIDQVILHPLETLETRITSYVVEDNVLYHQIKTQLKTDYYASKIALGDAPSYLKENVQYFSSDGHYFYEDVYVLIDDLLNEEYTNAINQEAYYSYYLYLPHRSLSSYSSEQLNSYFEEARLYDKRMDCFVEENSDSLTDLVNQSQYYKQINNFVAYQNIYGANALMMIALSVNESGYGKSYLAYTRNNLFGHAAYDSDVERYAARYLSVRNSIYSHAKYYISRSYANPSSSVYHGSFFGNKLSGMNVSYASDPYWGEKAAQHCYRLDKALGSYDYNQYALAISDGSSSVRVYRDSNLRTVSYRLNEGEIYSFIILEEYDNCYKIQSEKTSDSDYYYDYENMVAYIPKSSVSTVLNPEKINEKEYINYNFDGDGGYFNDLEEISIKVAKGASFEMIEPVKEGYKFLAFELISEEENKKNYIATYKEVVDYEISGLSETIEKDTYLQFKDAYITVEYGDGSSEKIDLNTDYISFPDTSEVGETTITVNYCGIEKSETITVIESSDIKNQVISNKLNKVSNISDLSELISLRKQVKESEYEATVEQMQDFDQAFYTSLNNNIDFVVDDSYDLDLGIAGLSLVFDIEESDSESKLFNNVYQIKEKQIDKDDLQRLIKAANSQGYEEYKAFGLSYYRNQKQIEAKGDIFIQIKAEDENDYYMVFVLDADNNIRECRSTRGSEYLQFKADCNASYLVAKVDSNNIYDLEDSRFLINSDNKVDIYHSDFFKKMIYILMITFILLLIFIYLKQADTLNKRNNKYRNLLRF